MRIPPDEFLVTHNMTILSALVHAALTWADPNQFIEALRDWGYDKTADSLIEALKEKIP